MSVVWFVHLQQPKSVNGVDVHHNGKQLVSCIGYCGDTGFCNRTCPITLKPEDDDTIFKCRGINSFTLLGIDSDEATIRVQGILSFF